MAERQSFSTENMFDDIPVKVDEVAASKIDAFFNDPDDIIIGDDEEEEEEEPIKKTPPKKVQDKPKIKPVQKQEVEEEEEEEDDVDPVDKILFGDEKTEDDDEDTDSSSDEDSSKEDGEGSQINKYQELANEFVDLGIISLDEDEELDIQDGEALVARIQKEHKKAAAIALDSFLSRFGEDYRQAFDAIFVQQVDPRDYFQTATKIEDLESLDLSSIDNQKRIFREHYRSLGMDEDRIESKLQKAIDYGDLEDDATDLHKILVQKYKDEQEQMIIQKQKENQRKAEQKKLYIQSINQILVEKLQAKEFDGIPLDSNFARDTFSFLTEERYRTPDGASLTEFDRYILDLKRPENYSKKVKLAMLAQMLEKDPTLSKLQRSVVTKESKKVFGKVIKHLDKQKTPQQKKKEQDNTSFFM